MRAVMITAAGLWSNVNHGFPDIMGKKYMVSYNFFFRKFIFDLATSGTLEIYTDDSKLH